MINPGGAFRRSARMGLEGLSHRLRLTMTSSSPVMNLGPTVMWIAVGRRAALTTKIGNLKMLPETRKQYLVAHLKESLRHLRRLRIQTLIVHRGKLLTSATTRTGL